MIRHIMSLCCDYCDDNLLTSCLTGLSAVDNATPLKTGDASRHKSFTNTLEVLIAFGLIERTEIIDSSPSSSRSSKRSFDRAGESLDILRVHSVVQAFFIDTLGEEKLGPFWIGRAAAIWCRSFDEADKKIKDQSDVGLPEDYRRFAIHGKKLLENAKKLEKKAPEELGKMIGEIELRLGKTEGEIDRLSQVMQKHIVGGSTALPPSSVFDRTNSSSETDSMSPPSHSSTSTSASGAILESDEDWAYKQFQSPVTYGPELSHDPYHFHMPYPQGPTIPVPSEPSDLDEDTVTVTASPNPNLSAEHAARRPSSKPRSSLSPGQQDSDWDFIVPHHRAVRKLESRRYRDHAGAWRDTSISDPRVSISRESAKGSISSIVAGSTRKRSQSTVTAGSEAEVQLHKIRQGIPSTTVEELSLLQDIGRRFSHGTPPRPRLMTDYNCHTEPLVIKAAQNEVNMSPAEFSSSLPKTAVASPSWMLKRLQENLQPAETDQIDGAQPVNGRRRSISPTPLFAGSTRRSLSISPRPRTSSFAPPPAVPVETGTEDSVKQGFPSTIRQWNTQTYHPTLSRVESSGLGALVNDDPMSFSYPSIQRPLPDPDPASLLPQTRPTAAQIQLTSPGGYTSQPMSRNPSGGTKSAQSHTSSAPAGGHSSSPPAAGTSSTPPGPPSRRGSTGMTRLFPFLIPKARRPSHTETEPSPKLGDAFPDVETSYRRYEGRQRQLSRSPPTAIRSPNWRSRRAQSQSPAPRGRRGRIFVRGGGGGGAVQSRGGSPHLGGEAMARNLSSGSGSGSGGILLVDGSIVGFGERRRGSVPELGGEGVLRETGDEEQGFAGLGIME